jgi:acetoin utilization protein AcuB
MFASQFISNEIFPLKKSDTVASAEVFMQDCMVKELPVVEGGKILGMVNESILQNTDKSKVEDCMNMQLDAYVIHEFAHYFELWQRFELTQFDSLVLVNNEQQFKGIVAAKDIMKHAYAKLALAQEGSFLIIEVSAIQYSLAEIARICESNEAKILHLMIETKGGEANLLHVSIKLNKTYLNHVMASLDRFGYHVIHTNSPLDPNHSLDDRYNWLLKYLNT